MYWHSWWIASIIILGIAVIDAIAVLFFRYKRNRIITPNRVLILGTWGSASAMFYPLYLRELKGAVSVTEYIKAGLVSIQHSIRLFAFDDGYMDMVDMVAGLEPGVQTLYTLLGSILYLAAPILTVGLILSFFKNLTSYIYYVFSFWKSTHVFSELNKKSLALAKSIDEVNNKKGQGQRRKYRFWKKALIVFTDVIDKDNKENLELIEEANEIGAILFTKDLESIKYRNRYFSLRKVNFYLISDDEEEKIRHAESVIAEYKSIKHTKLFLFSNNVESKSFLDAYTKKDKEGMCLEVIRVNDIRALIYHNLNDSGIRLFENANKLSDGTREISAVIVGLGQYGMEMVKALLWYCQLPGYRVKINVFDDREDAETIFNASCPEINTKELFDVAGDIRYTLKIQKEKYGTQNFYEAIKIVNDITYLFVGLGNDSDNIAASKGIRNWLAHSDKYPYIETVVYDSSLKDRIDADFIDQKINIIGDLASFYSEGTVINSALTNKGLEVHKRWDDSENPNNNYYMNDYNYYSSLASALHRNLREKIIAYNKVDEVFPFYVSYNNQAKELFQSLNNNNTIKALSEEMTTFADYLYIKLAHLHYKKLTVDERRKVLDILQAYMSEKKICLNIPMLNDVTSYYDGYDLFIQDFENDLNKKKTMRMIFDAIIKMKTSDEQDEIRKRQLIHSLEYCSLSESDKIVVCAYVKEKLGKGDSTSFTMDEYFKKGKLFAEIEHIRWNAYVRTEGFRRAVETKRKYKLHYDLVPVDKLTFADCIKDI